MAKFAQVGYGSQGQGLGRTTDGYTYVVYDNVTGATLTSNRVYKAVVNALNN